MAGFGFGQRWEANGSWVVSLLPTTGRVERESIMSGGIWRIWDGMGVALGEEIRQIKRPHPKTQSGLNVGKSGSAPSWTEPTLGWPLLLVVDMLGVCWWCAADVRHGLYLWPRHPEASSGVPFVFISFKAARPIPSPYGLSIVEYPPFEASSLTLCVW